MVNLTLSLAHGIHNPSPLFKPFRLGDDTTLIFLYVEHSVISFSGDFPYAFSSNIYVHSRLQHRTSFPIDETQ